MSFLHIADLAEAPSFRRRIAPCVAKVGGVVYGETPSGKFAVDTKRRELAIRCLRNPILEADQFIWVVLSNPQIAAAGLAATDNDLEFVISDKFSIVAGVTASDENEPVL